MLKIMTVVMLALATPSQAGLIAFADGVVTSGCDDCTGTGNSLFGFGPNYDLTGQQLRIEYEISDSFFARTPHFGGDRAIYWFTENPDDISASITINNKKYQLPELYLYDTYIGWRTDGSFFATLYHEDVDEPQVPGGLFDHYKGRLLAKGDGTVDFFYRHLRGWPEEIPQYAQLVGLIDELTLVPFAETSKVPEPSSLGLLALGIAALIGVRRRREAT